MELRQLKVFVAVAEELHFGRAALRLHLAQPSVSGHVRQLETEVGVQLLRRTSRHVELTDAGASFLADARRVLEQADVASRSVRRWHDAAQTELRVGYVADAIPRELPLTLHRLAAAPGAPRVTLRPGLPLKVLDDLRDGLVDVAVTSLPAPVAGLRVTTVGFERAVVAAPSMLREADERPVPLAMVVRRPLLALPRHRNPGFHDAIVAGLRAADLPASIVEVDAPSVQHLLLEVAGGAGVALVPEPVAHRVTMLGVFFRELAGAPAVGCPVAVVTRDEAPSAAVAAFTRLLPGVAREGRDRHPAVAA